MKIFSILLSTMLPLLMISNVFSPASAFSPVKVKLHDAATLPCNQTCSGLVTWTVFHKPHDILAQCDQTSCQSKEGFHMSHDQYLKGDLSLTITDVDYTKRTWYTCECDGVEICDVSVRIKPVNVQKNVHPSQSPVLDLPIPDSVEVSFNGIGDTSKNAVPLCNITGHEIQCNPEYKKKLLFSSSLQLKEMKESDSGVYTIRDTENNDVIATYTVIVTVNDSVKLHDATTLSCNQTCSGLVTWTMFHKPNDILAQCDQTSCQSKEGFHMSHDQYLKGDLSLTITDVDYSKRTWYTCECDGANLCVMRLRLEPATYQISAKPGGSLSMDVPVSERVDMIFNPTDETRTVTVKLCTITKRELQCISEYEKRVSFSSSLQLKEMKESDSGVYTIRDTRNDEVIATYTITFVGCFRRGQKSS